MNLVSNFLFIRSDSSLEPGSFEPYDDEDFLNDDSNSSPTKQTPIKSWLKNYMNSEKSPEMSVLKSPPHSQPQYIIPLVRRLVFNFFLKFLMKYSHNSYYSYSRFSIFVIFYLTGA